MSRVGTIEVVPYNERWAEAQTGFARRNWPGKARRADPDYLRWEYRGPRKGPVPGLLLAVTGDEVVGQLGMIPGQALVSGRLESIQWIGNLMVDPEHRRKGISTAIFRAALDRPVITLGTDPSPSAAPMMATVGFDRADSSELMVLPLRMGPVVATRYPQVARLVRPLTALGVPATRYLTRRLRDAQRSRLAQVCTWQDVVADVVAAEAALAVPHAVHDQEFLGWRCPGFPPWTREVDAVRTPNGSFAVLERAGDRMLVLHWHGVSPEETAALLGRATYLAESYGMDYLQAMATDPDQVAQLASLGFRPRRTPTDLWCFPAGAIGDERFVVQGYDTDQNL